MEYPIEKKANPESSWTFLAILKYGFIAFLIFILTIGVPSIAVFLGIKFLPAMILWALSGFWFGEIILLFCVPVLCTALAALILIGCIYGACELFSYLSKLSDKKNENLKLENPTKRNWLKRILAFFGCIAFGLSTVIFPVCMLVLALDAIYIVAVLIILAIFIVICIAPRDGGCNRCDMPSGGCCDCDCSSSYDNHKSGERDKLDNSHCGFLDCFPGPKAFYCCLKILFSGENPTHKGYYELRNKCFVEVNKLLKDETVNENCFDQLLEEAQNVNSADRKKLRTEIMKIIIEKQIIPLAVVLAIKQNESVEQVFGLQEISKNQQQGALKFANFRNGIVKLLRSTNINKNSNQINLRKSVDLPSEKEIKQPQTINQSVIYNFFPGEAAPAPALYIHPQDQIIISNNNDNNKISNKPKHNINCNDEDGKKLIMAWNCCSYSIEKYLDDAKNQCSLYEHLIPKEEKPKESKNEITIK